MFVPVLLVWLDASYFADLFDTDDLWSRATLVLVVLGSLVLATGVHSALPGDPTVFVLSYLGLRLFLAGVYGVVALRRPAYRSFASRFAGAYLLALVGGLVLTLVVERDGRGATRERVEAGVSGSG